MPRLMPLILFLIFLVGFSASSRNSFADELSDIKKQIDKTSKKLDDLTKERDDLEKRLSDLTKNLSATKQDIDYLTGQIVQMEARLVEINNSLDEKRIELAGKIDLRNRIVRAYYRENSINELELFLLSLDLSSDLSNKNISKGKEVSGFQRISQSYIAHKVLTQNTLSAIAGVNKEIAIYEKNKKDSENLKTSLASQKEKLSLLRASLEEKQAETQKEINTLDNEISKVNASLSDLSSKQQELLREKFGATSESTTVGDDEQAGSTLPDPPFSSAYAFFSYGYPHRVGANQYGMYGRAKSGQNYKDIIKAYFKDVEISGGCDKDKTISVQGYGNLKLEETYLMGIAEMPESWGDKGGYEALKAQVVLARTYALNYTEYYYDSKSQTIKKSSSKKSICTTQSCQVYTGGKKTGKWKKAVEETCGVLVKYNGSPITAWYASTSGGYTRTAGQVWGGERPWSKGIRDAKCLGNIFDCAYDGPNYGSSPWFHKAWGVNKTSGSAWLKESETEDLFNAYLLSEKNSSYNQYLSPTAKGGWSTDKVIEKLEDLGVNPVGKIKDIYMKDDGAGYTTSVVLSSDNYSSKSFDGYKFKSIFNLRSPGTLIIWTSFYDVLIK